MAVKKQRQQAGESNAPVAWAVTCASGQDVYEAFAAHQKDEAELLAEQCLFGKPGPLPLRPLYFAPTLTDAEREAIEVAADFIDAKSYANSDTLRSLLERLGDTK